MEMKVDVSISLDGKRITGNVTVEQQDWELDPLHEVLKALKNQYGLELTRFYTDRKVKVDYGETIGRFDMDMTDTLEEETIKDAMSWMAIDISKSGEVTLSEESYFMELLKSLQKTFPVLRERRACHMCHPDDYYNEREDRLDDLIIHFNDNHDWTIGEIADWLETLDADIGMKQ